MIGTRTPFRISFAGGGSDLPVFYREEPGCVLSTTINKYMYIFVHPFFEDKIQVKYSRTELVDRAEEIQHPLVRQALLKHHMSRLDINSIADIPAGTGLGSSSSYAVGLIHALHAFRGEPVNAERLASEACDLEINQLGEPIGKQDQYAAAFGGMNFFTFYADESVQVESLPLSDDFRNSMVQRLLMFYFGQTRNARTVLQDQSDNLSRHSALRYELRAMARLASLLRQELLAGRLDDMGLILDEGWQRKRKLSNKISNPAIDAYYDRAKAHGATGGKLLGAGGSGFLLLYCLPEHQARLRAALKDLTEFSWDLDRAGSKLIFSDQTINIQNNHPIPEQIHNSLLSVSNIT